MTDVTIRGIDDAVYAQFAAEAKKRGLAIGELTTIAMRSVVAESTRPVFKIGDLEMLVVSKADLESLDGQVVLQNIDLLEFDSSVDWPTFNDRVKEIDNVEVLTLHKTLSKFQVLTRSKNVEVFMSK